jgi:hypothetical protein
VTRIPKSTEIETHSGRYVDLIDPQVADLNVEDVAHHLAKICRYTGACKRFYSVAEHAVRCAQWLDDLGFPPEVVYGALHHDDPEAYLQDISRPFKQQFQPRYGELTALFQIRLAEAYGHKWLDGYFDDQRVKTADNAALLMEAKVLLPSQGAGWKQQALNWDMAYDDGVMPPTGRLGWSPRKATRRYLRMHRRLEKELARGHQ